MYFHLRIILHHFGNFLPYENGFSNAKNFYIKSAYYRICGDYGVNADKTWMTGDWCYKKKYGVLGNEGKATESSSPDSLIRWIITQSKGFTVKGIGKTSRPVKEYLYLVLTSQIQTRLSTVGNSVSAIDVQQVFKSTFKALIIEDYSISADINKYQSVLEHALSKEDFSVVTSIYMLPSNLNLNIGNTVEYSSKILISNTDMKTGPNKNIKKPVVYIKNCL